METRTRREVMRHTALVQVALFAVAVVGAVIGLALMANESEETAQGYDTLLIAWAVAGVVVLVGLAVMAVRASRLLGAVGTVLVVAQLATTAPIGVVGLALLVVAPWTKLPAKEPAEPAGKQ